MKLQRILYPLLICFFLLVSCQQDESSLSTGVDTGYLSFSSIGVALDVKPIAARAVDPALVVEIQKADGTPVIRFDAGSVETSENIALEAGSYLLKAYTSNYGTTWEEGEKGEPIFYKEQPFVIEKGAVNNLSVTVPMSNVGVRLVLPEGFGQWFGSYSFSTQLGNRTIILKNGEIAYFNLPEVEGNNQLEYALFAINIDGEPHNIAGTVTNITSGVLYEVTYSFVTQSLVLR